MPTDTGISPREVVTRGEEWYERHFKQQLKPDYLGEFLVVDVDTGDYEMGRDYIQPTERLLAKRPGAVLYALRVGCRAVGRIGVGLIGGRYTPARR